MDGGATEIEGVKSVEDLGRLEKWWNIPSIVMWSFIFFGSFLLNATLLLALLKRPGLRTISNRFVMNLAASNLLTVTLMNSLLIFDNEDSNAGHCALAEGATALVTTSSILSVLLIAVDQYLAVVDPLRYRTRIDKLKCTILIFTVWIISIIFTLLATLNPNPKSLWLACNKNTINISNSSTIQIFIERQKNNTLNSSINVENIDTNSNSTFINNTILLNNDDIIINNDIFIISYGFIYTMTVGLIIYLLPFIGVCWIYIKIYLAAHKNSERTRQNGSRPILSTCSFTDDYYSPIRHDLATINDDNTRRIPKISSLSSIDESIETATSQLPIQCSNINDNSTIISENNDFNINNSDNTDDNINNSAVIFTVGEKRVCVKNKLRKQSSLMTKDNIKVPISTLKRQFLSDKSSQQSSNIINCEIQTHLTHNNDDKRKSLHNLTYNNGISDNFMNLQSSNDHFTNEDSDSEDECVIKTINDAQYPPLMNNCDFEVRNDELMMNFRQKVQNSSSNRDNLLNSRNDGRFSNNININCQNNTTNNCGNRLANDLNSINATNANTTPIVTITPPNKIPLHRVSSTRSTTSYINCLKYRISNASMFKYREETRAARISALVIVMGFICWTPFYVVSILKNCSFIVKNNLPHDFDIIAMSFLIFATYVTPLLFGYRSRRVKRELRKLFCFRNELSYKNNRSLMAKKVLKRRHSGNLSNSEMDNRYNIFNCVYGKNKWPKEKVQFVQVPDTALAVETCRSSFSSGASTQISSTSTDEN